MFNFRTDQTLVLLCVYLAVFGKTEQTKKIQKHTGRPIRFLRSSQGSPQRKKENATQAAWPPAAPTSVGKGRMACATALPPSHTIPDVTSPWRKGTANALASHTETIYIQSSLWTTCISSFPPSDSAASPSYIFSKLS